MVFFKLHCAAAYSPLLVVSVIFMILVDSTLGVFKFRNPYPFLLPVTPL